MNQEEIKDLIKKVADEEGIDVLLLYATVGTESNFDELAYRFEPGYLRRYIIGKEPWSRLHEKYGDMVAASYGLVQIMYPTAVSMGYKGDPEGLFNAEVNLTMGARYIKAGLIDTGDDPILVATRYNTGSINGTPHPGHIERFLSWYEKGSQIWTSRLSYKTKESIEEHIKPHIVPALAKLYEQTALINVNFEDRTALIRCLNQYNRILVRNGLRELPKNGTS